MKIISVGSDENILGEFIFKCRCGIMEQFMK